MEIKFSDLDKYIDKEVFIIKEIKFLRNKMISEFYLRSGIVYRIIGSNTLYLNALGTTITIYEVDVKAIFTERSEAEAYYEFLNSPG